MTAAISTSRDATEVAELQQLQADIGSALRRGVQHLIEAGKGLARAKELLAHGEFGSWVEQTFRMSRRTAENLMAAADRFGDKSETVAHLPAGVLYELSSPSTPEHVVKGVLGGSIPANVNAIRQAKKVLPAARRDLDDREAAASVLLRALWRFKEAGGKPSDLAEAMWDGVEDLAAFAQWVTQLSIQSSSLITTWLCEEQPQTPPPPTPPGSGSRLGELARAVAQEMRARRRKEGAG